MIRVLSLIPNTMEENKRDQLVEKMIGALQQADGLRSLSISESHIMSPGGPPPYAKVVEASFDSLEDFMDWVQTPAAQADKEQMLGNGVVSIFYEVKKVINRS